MHWHWRAWMWCIPVQYYDMHIMAKEGLNLILHIYAKCISTHITCICMHICQCSCCSMIQRLIQRLRQDLSSFSCCK